MDSMFHHMKKLYENEMYANVLPIATILETTHSRDRSYLSPEQYFLLLVYHGHSLFHERQYRKADISYRKALEARKLITKPTKPQSLLASTYEQLVEQYPENEIRFRIGLCMEQTKQFSEAISMLTSIPAKHRQLKVNMLLGRLAQQTGRYPYAITAFKLVLRECPMNLEAIKMLFMLNVPESDIDLLVSESNLPTQCIEMLTGIIEAYTAMYQCKFSEAIDKLEAVEETSQFSNNEVFNVLIGQCYYYNGEFDKALLYLQRTYASNYNMVDGLMQLAALYASKGRIDDLEKLTMPAMTTAEYQSEHWFVWAQYLFCQGKYDKAAYFAQKACYLANNRNIEAALLKIKSFIEMKKFEEAIVQLKGIQDIAMYRFEVYECLVVAYCATNRCREAQMVATDCVRKLGKTPRTYVLVARPLFTVPVMKAKAKPFLEKALEIDESYVPAILLLVDLLFDEEDYVTVIALLRSVVAIKPTSRLLTLLANAYVKEKDNMKAVEFYTKAINMDPTNRKATNALLELEQAGKNEEGAYVSTTAGDDDESDNSFRMVEHRVPHRLADVVPDIDPEGDGMWSDVEIEVAGNS